MIIKSLKDFVVETIKEYTGKIGIEIVTKEGYPEFKRLDTKNLEEIFKNSSDISIYENEADRILSTLVIEGDDYTQYNFAILDLAMGKFKSLIGEYFETYGALDEEMEFKKGFTKEGFQGNSNFLNSYLDFGIKNDYWLMIMEIECNSLKELQNNLEEIKKLILENN